MHFPASITIQVRRRFCLASLAWFFLFMDTCFEHVKSGLLIPLLFRQGEDLAWLISFGLSCSWMCVLRMLDALSCFYCYSSEEERSCLAPFFGFLLFMGMCFELVECFPIFVKTYLIPSVLLMNALVHFIVSCSGSKLLVF